MKEANVDIYLRVKKFAVQIVKLCHVLNQDAGARRTLSHQLIRSGTSIGANCYEAKYAESKADFIHKLKISRKENSETIFWLEVLADSGIVSQEHINPLLKECEEIGKILTTIIKKREQSNY